MGEKVVFHLHEDTSNCNGYADSCTKYDEYIKLAKRDGDTAIAFSNHGGIYDWVKKKQSCDKAKIKYIHGVELYLCNKLEDNHRGWHIGLYAKNWDGVQELNTLMSLSTNKGTEEDNTDRHFYFNPRISIEELMNTSDNIIVTTACLASALWKLFNEYAMDVLTEEQLVMYNENILIRQKLLKWLSLNKHRCFLEIQYHNCNDQINYNKMLYKWSKEYDIPLIAGTDTHSSTEYKAECRKVLQISKDSFYGDEDAFDLTWKTYDELVNCFKNQNALPEDVYMMAIGNTNKLADMVEDFTLDRSFKYPTLYGDNADEQWRAVIDKKLQEKIDRNEIDITRLDEYKAMIDEEFEAMSKQGMGSFMLFMSELMTWCRENGIQSAPCRGSVGGSEIAYITDVTDVDPIVWGTVFSRFCNAERISLADIDQDFAPKDRIKVYEYIISRFGNKNVAYILTLGTIQDRGSIDVLAKGLGYTDLEKVKQIKNTFDKSFHEYEKVIQECIGDLKELSEFEDITSLSPSFDDHEIYIRRISDKNKVKILIDCKKAWDKLREDNKDLFYYFDGIKGTIVSKGNHPAGMIGSPITLHDNLGVFYRKGDENFPVSFCSMKAVDSLNYVKFDILGLKTVGVLQDTFRLANVDWKYAYQMDWNDKKVWADMIRCNSSIFQFEGEYAHDLLKQMISKMINAEDGATINHMSMVNAGLRPSGKSYRDRLVNGEVNKNPSKEIDDLLSSNNGFLIFQEDTIKFLTDICGFSGSMADTTRRCIGKKLKEELDAELPKIINGYCEKSSSPREIAEQEAKQFVQIISDSSDYQFGLNHSTGYSMVGYMCAYARTYFTLEFITSYFNWCENDVDMNNGMKMIKEYGVTLNSPQFRYSKGEYFFDREDNSIYKGIGSLKSFGNHVGDDLYELRENTYKSFIDLLVDIKTKTSTDKGQLNSLIKINFFKEFGSIKYLLSIVEVFDNFYGKKTLKKDKLVELGLDFIDMNQYATDVLKKGNISETTWSNLDSVGLIKEVISTLPQDEFDIKTILTYQKDILGYIDYVNPELDKRYAMVYSLDDRFATKKCELYCLNNGKIATLKINKKSYSESPFEEGSLIYTNTLEKKFKSKVVGKDDKGRNIYEKLQEMEWWITKATIINEL